MLLRARGNTNIAGVSQVHQAPHAMANNQSRSLSSPHLCLWRLVVMPSSRMLPLRLPTAFCAADSAGAPSLRQAVGVIGPCGYSQDQTRTTEATSLVLLQMIQVYPRLLLALVKVVLRPIASRPDRLRHLRKRSCQRPHRGMAGAQQLQSKQAAYLPQELLLLASASLGGCKSKANMAPWCLELALALWH